MREDGAAAKLQAAQRGRAARKELDEQKAAAVRIQAVHRGAAGRRAAGATRAAQGLDVPSDADSADEANAVRSFDLIQLSELCLTIVG